MAPLEKGHFISVVMDFFYRLYVMNYNADYRHLPPTNVRNITNQSDSGALKTQKA